MLLLLLLNYEIIGWYWYGRAWGSGFSLLPSRSMVISTVYHPSTLAVLVSRTSSLYINQINDHDVLRTFLLHIHSSFAIFYFTTYLYQHFYIDDDVLQPRMSSVAGVRCM